LSWPKRILLGLFFTGFTVTILGLAALVYAYNKIEFPEPNAEFATETTRLYFGDASADRSGLVTGTELGSFAEQNRIAIAYADMPQSIKDAVLAAENRGFWTDPGISFTGIARAAKNIILGEPLQSGSTITQQYIKVLYLSSDQTATRKIKEILLAVKSGRGGEMRKQDVLAGYLNTVYFGRGAYGVEAAAETYFGVTAKQLTLPQSVALAVILNAPSLFDPAADGDDQENDQRFTERYEYILDGLLEMGQKAVDEAPQPFVGITAAEYADAWANPPALQDEREVDDVYGGTNGYLVRLVESELLDSGAFTEDQVYGGGLQVVTTFDPAAQAAAVATVQEWTASTVASARTPDLDPATLHGGLASVAVGTGEVVALYGGPDALADYYDWATTPRPAGSTFKPYALIAALRQGLTLSTTVSGNTFTPPGDTEPIHNDQGEGDWLGQMSLAYATTHSINTAYVDLVVNKLQDGYNAVVQAANDLGVPTDPSWADLGGRIALGTGMVSALDAANAYATLGNQGRYVPVHAVREVWDHGRLICLYSEPAGDHCAEPTSTQAVTEEVAATATYALSSVMSEGTGARHAAGFAWPVAGKTGTAGNTDEAGSIAAAWYIGYTKQISTAVMFCAGNGYEDLNAYMPSGVGFYGGTVPGDVWHDYMTQVMAGKEAIPFDQPKDTGPAVTVAPEPTPTPTEPVEEFTVDPNAEPTAETTESALAPEPEPTQPAEPEPVTPEVSEEAWPGETQPTDPWALPG
jgi:membrane peptidoglycan carboxypeptidase